MKYLLSVLIFTGCAHFQKPKIEKVQMSIKQMPDRTWYLVRHAQDDKGNCFLSRSQIEAKLDKRGAVVGFAMRMNGTTETCKGKNCEHCKFKTSGGCECVNSLNICEHTITKNRDVMRLR